MLQELVERKRKYDALKATGNKFRLLTFILFALYLIYLTIFVIQPYSHSFETLISIYLNNSFHLVSLLIIITGYSIVLFYDKKVKKAENEYDDLRCEIIRKSSELWPQPNLWNKREKVYEVMKREFDINLYYENK